MNNEKEKEQSIDEMLLNLDQILHQMENDELSLEETFAFYEQGVRQIQQCRKELDQVEKKMQILTSEGTLEEF